MQDSAPSHPAKIVTHFLKSKKIQILDWSGNSPDLNAIESLWTVLKDKVFERQPTNAKMFGTSHKRSLGARNDN